MARTLRRIRTITASATGGNDATASAAMESSAALHQVIVVCVNIPALSREPAGGRGGSSHWTERCPVGSLQRRRHEDVEKDPRGEDEKEHGYLVLLGGPNSKPARHGT